ncbi:hypothetical protein [Aeromicrobium sp. CnD17-E]|uniref:hypothetical protein n=1 Tax=Aeromicrobium sp. CnD17-E TaxID=2954487 RepID=UPI002097E857|nr:hypothetical protein [Aeromicrobium sp. CnD17-E]MCO7238979.1 hypothetical protein [Aeromicrobium sp. CnD17-E]
MFETAMLSRATGLLAFVLCLATPSESTAAAGVAVLIAAALVVAVGSRVVVEHRVTGVGVRPGEAVRLVPVLSSRIADPVRQPVRPRAPGLV